MLRMQHRSRRHAFLPFVLLALTGIGCRQEACPEIRYPMRNGDRVTITQGLWGDVWFWSGDFMPPVGCGGSRGSVTAVSREILVYSPTTPAMVDSSFLGGFFQGIHSTLIARTRSDDAGFFEVALEPGAYSLFVLEDSLLYANVLGGNGTINPVEIRPQAVTETRFDINWAAAY